LVIARESDKRNAPAQTPRLERALMFAADRAFLFIDNQEVKWYYSCVERQGALCMKLRVRVSLIIIAIMIVAVASISMVLLNRAGKMQLQTTLRSAERLAEEESRNVKSMYDSHIQTARTLAQLMGGYENFETNGRRAIFIEIMRRVFESNPYLVALYSVWDDNALDGQDALYAGDADANRGNGFTETGKFVPLFSRESGGTILRICRDHKDILGSLTRDEVVSAPEPRTVKAVDTYSVDFIVPIITPQNKIVGAVGLILDLAEFQSTVDLIVSGNNDVAEAAMYAHDGTITGHLFKARLGENLKEADQALYTNDIDKVFAAVQSGQALRLEKRSATLNENMQIILSPFNLGDAKTPWSIMIGVPESVILSEVRAMTVFSVIIGLVFAAVTSFVIFVIVTGITKPIKESEVAAITLAKMQYDITLSSQKRRDEIGELQRSLFTIRDNLQKKLEAMNLEIVSQHKNISANLKDVIKKSAEELAVITGSINLVEEKTGNQMESVNQTANAVDDIVQHINALENAVESQTRNSVKSSEAIEKMVEDVDSVRSIVLNAHETTGKLSKSSGEGRKMLGELTEELSIIAGQSTFLEEANATLVNIAAQTNILAMNAAIEAAHAGESGRGFAVVAGEIRNLAASSNRESASISNEIKKMRNNIANIQKASVATVHTMGAMFTEINDMGASFDEVTQAVEAQAANGAQVLDALSALRDTVGQVREGSSEIQKRSGLILESVENLKRISREVTDNVANVKSASQNISGSLEIAQKIADGRYLYSVDGIRMMAMPDKRNGEEHPASHRAKRYTCKAGISIKGFEGIAALKDISASGFCMMSKTYITIAPKEVLTIRITPESVTGVGAFDIKVEVRWIKCSPTLFMAGFLIKEKNGNKLFQHYIDYLTQKRPAGIPSPSPKTISQGKRRAETSSPSSKMVFQWSDSLATGNEQIDSEHKQLIVAINDFFAACSMNSGGDKMLKTINFLLDYTVKHFYNEERLQLQYKYPGYDNHKKFHENFKKNVHNLMVEFINKGASDELIKQAKHDIGEVIIAHIQHEDMRLAAHIKGQQS
jgi:methyl-accepting chemotaxis protein